MPPSNNQNPLAELHDIIGPGDASFWPIPLIYWAILAALVLLWLSVIYFNKKRASEKASSESVKQALLQLQILRENNGTFIDVNQLLKWVSLSYFPREKVASLHGKQWFKFLQTHTVHPIFSDETSFIEHLYRHESKKADEDHFRDAERWLTGLNVQLKKQNETGEQCSN